MIEFQKLLGLMASIDTSDLLLTVEAAPQQRVKSDLRPNGRQCA